MRTLSVMLMLVLTSACAGKNGPELKGVEGNKASTFKVMIMPQGHGSGVVVHEDGYMITNHHVCGGGERELRITVSERGGEPRTYAAESLAWDEEMDLCALKVDATFAHPVMLEDYENLHEGDSVYNIGFPYSFGKLIDRGTIAKLKWDKPSFGVRNGILVDVEFAHPGSSGSGVYLLRSGKLIGLIKMMAWRQPTRGLKRLPRMTVKILVGVDDIRDFLDANRIPYHAGHDDGRWSVPVSGEPPPYQIEINQIEPAPDLSLP